MLCLVPINSTVTMQALLCAQACKGACDTDFVNAAARPASARKAAGQKAAQTRKANAAAGKPKVKHEKGTGKAETGTQKAAKAETRANLRARQPPSLLLKSRVLPKPQPSLLERRPTLLRVQQRRRQQPRAGQE